MKPTFSIVVAACCAASQAVVLYDGSSGQLPDHPGWGWNYGATGGSTGVGGGATTLDTLGDIATSAGWGRLAPFTLDPSAGFTVRFELRIESEDHSAPGADKNGDSLADRAGFSVIVLGADRRGVELGFWEDEVWAQQDVPLFIHSPISERTFRDTRVMTRYEVTVVGSSYELRADGALVMSGSSKDYTAFAGFPDPYETPNFLFFGDNTSSASARAQIAYVEATPVPEPSTMALALGIVGLLRRRLLARKR